ncbi:unnamed protein product [Ambrosiozyma monospora]|uniref:Unnamed protein product n=1 Tax=Ambrosiozyma monospora TaxID=43982 RepID=A0ACB5TWL1_AMBMO|nr:unnamed protein product [Ambrosiozyma monospora]
MERDQDSTISERKKPIVSNGDSVTAAENSIKTATQQQQQTSKASSSSDVQSTETKANSTKEKQEGSLLTLVICVLGIYGSFLTWSYLQEKINFKDYSPTPSIVIPSDTSAFSALSTDQDQTKPQHFKAPLIINIIQSLFAIIVGTFYLSQKTGHFQTPLKFIFNNTETFKLLLLISLSQSLSSQIAYKSLNYVDYVFYLLAKSCKLIPVMLVHLIVYKSKFPGYKYLVAGIITLGVLIFTLGSPKKKSESGNDLNEEQR